MLGTIRLTGLAYTGQDSREAQQKADGASMRRGAQTGAGEQQSVLGSDPPIRQGRPMDLGVLRLTEEEPSAPMMLTLKGFPRGTGESIQKPGRRRGS